MPNYRYHVRTANGQVQHGELIADSVVTAAAVLRNQGLHVVGLTPSQGSITNSAFFAKLVELNTKKPKQKHVLDFTTQLAVMIRAGINLRAALDGIAEQQTHKGFKKIIIGLKNDVESGKQFSEAIAKHPKLFNPLYINMVKASEMSGSFAAMLDRIAQYIGQQLETRKMVIGASIYPAIIGVMATGVTVFLLTFVLPRFYAVFEGKEDVLPWATTFLMALSMFVVAKWPFLVGGAFGFGLGFYLFAKTDVGRFWIDKAKLHIPIMRAMYKSLYISRSLQTMGQLINAGVPMLDTLKITGEISGNRMFEGLWKRVYTSVKQGKKITQPLQKDNLLPRSVVQMISAGEESGKLGEVLDEISVYYAKQLRDNIKTATSMIEPLMILLMGAIVGFIAMAIILPIFKMSQIVQ